jgi:hypothetical protein
LIKALLPIFLAINDARHFQNANMQASVSTVYLSIVFKEISFLLLTRGSREIFLLKSRLVQVNFQAKFSWFCRE